MKEVRSAKEFFLKELHGQGSPSPLGNALGSENKILETVCDFLDALSVQDFKRAEEVIFAIPKIGGQDLLREIGRITRKLHNSIRTFKEAIDPQLKNITQKDLPSAIDSLQLVMAKTEEAADKTMAIVEKQLDNIEAFSGLLSQLTGPEDHIQSLNFFKDSLQQDLTEILLAQGFQDLTGQIIKKVIALVNDMEIELVKLITTFGIKMEGRADIKSAPTADFSPVKISQNDVDSLLAEFGF